MKKISWNSLDTKNFHFLLKGVTLTLLLIFFNNNLVSQHCPLDWSCDNQKNITIEFASNADAVAALPLLMDFTFGGITWTGSVNGTDIEYDDSPEAADCPTAQEISQLLNMTFFGSGSTCDGCFIVDDLGKGGMLCDPLDTTIDCAFINEDGDNCLEIMDLTNGCGNNGYKCADLFFHLESLLTCPAIGGSPSLLQCVMDDPMIMPILTFEITQGSGCNAGANSPNVYNADCEIQIGSTVIIQPDGDIEAELPLTGSEFIKYTVCTSSNNLSISGLVITADGCCPCEDPPMINCSNPNPPELVCNPTDANNDGIPDEIADASPAANGVTATSPNMGCAPNAVHVNPAAIPTTTDGCTYTLVRTYKAVNDCGDLMSDECSVTYTWKMDNTKPVITQNNPPPSTDFGCVDAPPPAPTFSVTETCGPIGSIKVETDDSQNGDGCNYTQTWTATYVDECGNEAMPVEVTYTWKMPEPVSLTCPPSITLEACNSQAEVDAAYLQWLHQVSFTGGCNANLSVPYPSAPNYCGGEITITWAVISDCEDDVTCSRTFKVLSPDPIVLHCPMDKTISSCLSQDDVKMEFKDWMDSFKSTGGCEGGVIISEVLYDATSGDNGLEWVELFNTGTQPVDLSGYSLGNGGVNYTYSKVQLNGTIAPGATFVVGGPTSNASNGNPTYDQVANFSPDFQNGGTESDGVALFDIVATSVHGATIPIDAVIYDSPNSNNLLDRYGLFGTPHVGDAGPGSSVERTNNSGNWIIQSTPTPNSISGTSITGNIGPKGTFTVVGDGPLEAPDKCGGSITVKWTVNDQSDCTEEKSCTKTFKVTDVPLLAISCPKSDDFVLPACSTQGEIVEAFKKWKDLFKVEGGCGTTSNIGELDALQPPSFCGTGNNPISFTLKASDQCDQSAECTATFTVKNAPILSVSCPKSEDFVVPPCNNQGVVNEAFAKWKAAFKVVGGCGTSSNIKDLDNIYPPNNCGTGDTPVSFTLKAKDDCGQVVECTSTFTVKDAPEITISCPDDFTMGSCNTEEAVEEAFKAWLDKFDGGGGCDAKGYFKGDPKAPSPCGGSTTVTWVVADEGPSADCTEDLSCTKTFYVKKPDELIASCPPNVTIPACQSQEYIDIAFKEWLDKFQYVGGCNPKETLFDVVQPKACGSSTDVEYLVEDDCGQISVCGAASFRVLEPEELYISCPENVILTECLSQEEVDDAFDKWLSKFDGGGGCGAQGYFASTPISPDFCGGTTTV
ncbi:MAG: hypothetical protein HKN09_11670, partial [Saprospiraceae bacterium]|nr:hypothetical protein [Saprospiraceae bacterium]